MLLRFRAERQILANLNHANIAGLLDGGVMPDGSPISSWNTLMGFILLDKGSWSEALVPLGQCLAVYKQGYGENDHHVASPLNNLARAYAMKGDPARAETLFRSALVWQ